MHNIHTLFKMVSNTKTFHWVSGRQIFKLALTTSKPIPLLLAGTWTCFWIQNDLSWQSHPIQHLDDHLDPVLNLLNLVSMRLYQMWGTSPVKQRPTLQHVYFPWRSGVSWALPTQSGAWKAASPSHDCAGAEKDRLLHNNGMSLGRFLMTSIIPCFPLAKAFSYSHSWEAQWPAKPEGWRNRILVMEYSRVACSRWKAERE